MLTATSTGLAAFIPTPPAEYGAISPNTEEVQLNINMEGSGDDRHPVFSFSVGNKFLDPTKDTNLATMDELLSRLEEHVKNLPNKVEVTINAHPDVKSGIVRDLTARLESEPFRSHILQKYIGVSEK